MCSSSSKAGGMETVEDNRGGVRTTLLVLAMRKSRTRVDEDSDISEKYFVFWEYLSWAVKRPGYCQETIRNVSPNFVPSEKRVPTGFDGGWIY